MTRRTIDDQTRARVLSFVQQGKGRNETAKLAQVSAGTVTNIMRAAGLGIPEADRARTERMTRAAAEFSRARRLEALGALADAARGRLAAGNLSPRELKDLAITIGIATQRSREEMGEDRPQAQGQHTVIVYVPSNGRGENPPADAQTVVDVQARLMPPSSEQE